MCPAPLLHANNGIPIITIMLMANVRCLLEWDIRLANQLQGSMPE